MEKISIVALFVAVVFVNTIHCQQLKKLKFDLITSVDAKSQVRKLKLEPANSGNSSIAGEDVVVSTEYCDTVQLSGSRYQVARHGKYNYYSTGCYDNREIYRHSSGYYMYATDPGGWLVSDTRCDNYAYLQAGIVARYPQDVAVWDEVEPGGDWETNYAIDVQCSFIPLDDCETVRLSGSQYNVARHGKYSYYSNGCYGNREIYKHSSGYYMYATDPGGWLVNTSPCSDYAFLQSGNVARYPQDVVVWDEVGLGGDWETNYAIDVTCSGNALNMKWTEAVMILVLSVCVMIGSWP